MPRTTYQVGLIQAQAYRNLQSLYRQALAPYAISIPEWSLLGLLYDQGKFNLSALSDALQSKASHSTNLVNELERRRLVRRISDPHDHRAKLVTLTTDGSDLVRTAEGPVRAAILRGLKLIDRSELEVYFRTLTTLAGRDVAFELSLTSDTDKQQFNACTVGCSDFNQACSFRITADEGQEDMMVDVATAHALRYHSEFSDNESVFRKAIRSQIKKVVTSLTSSGNSPTPAMPFK